MPHWTATSADSGTAYVTNELSNDVSVVDLGNQTITATIPVGNAPRKIAIQPSVLSTAASTLAQ
jgi:YVTN family beta-propeller protein